MASRSPARFSRNPLLTLTPLILLLAPAALGQQPTLSTPTLDCGGGPSFGVAESGTVFALIGAIGQHAAATPIGGLAGTSASGVTFHLVGGASAGKPPHPPCAPDFNHDGELNPDDLGDFITCYFTEPPCTQGDYNHDGDFNPDDLGDFITAYFIGCS